MMLTIGAHITIAKGFTHAAKTALAMGGNTFQFFSRNPRGSSLKNPDPKDLEGFERLREGMGPILAHAPYTVNLASPKPATSEFAREAVREDLMRMERAGIELFNTHPGSHVGCTPEEGIRNIIENLNDAMESSSQITLLLETMSGKGNEVGYRFEQLRQIMDGLKQRERVGVCMDLCHVYSAGYDIVNDLEGVLAEFDRVIGLDRLKAVHLNDSMNPFHSRKDRHAPIGEGSIGLDAAIGVITHPLLRHLPYYLETPLDEEGHKEEISRIRRLAGEAGGNKKTAAP